MHRLLTGSPYSIGVHIKIKFLNTFLMGTLHSPPLFLFLLPHILSFFVVVVLFWVFLFVLFFHKGRKKQILDTSEH